MSQPLAKVALHMIFSTKGRTPWLRDEALRQELYAYMASILRDMDSPAIEINGVEDHVHLLFLLSRNHAIKAIAQEIKVEPSKWIKKQAVKYQDFHWQGGYSIFSVSESMIPAVRRYIENQQVHHKRMSFQEELRLICQKHGVEIDERYVWD